MDTKKKILDVALTLFSEKDMEMYLSGRSQRALGSRHRPCINITKVSRIYLMLFCRRCAIDMIKKRPI